MTNLKEEKKSTERKKGDLREWIETIVTALILALFIRAVFIQAYKIPTGSMEPTLRGAETYGVGDHLIVNKFIYGSKVDLPFKIELPRLPKIKTPKRGEIVVFKYPGDDKKTDYVKRVIGLPGEMIEIKNKVVYINGEKLEEKYLTRNMEDYHQDPNILNSKRDNMLPRKIPEGCYFMMGDNRDNSSDSRVWGVLEYKYIRGQALFVYWPPHRIRIVK